MENESILVTGASGTLGCAIIEELITHYAPKNIRAFSRSEYLQHLAKEKLPYDKVSWIIGDVRDYNRVLMATRRVDTIINCAAIKRIDAAYNDPIECKKTNIDGVDNIIMAALQNNVKRIFQISTDKAVNPINLYGKTKAVAEDLMLNANNYSPDRFPMFSVGRYGNFEKSNGSVEQLFERQKSLKHALTVTHPDMKRYYITPDEAAKLTCRWIDVMQGGEIFIPMMPQKHIMTIAKSISDDIEFIGMRNGEKIEEELFNNEEKKYITNKERYYVIKK